MPEDKKPQTLQEKAVERSRIVKLLKAMGMWPGEDQEEEDIEGVEEPPRVPVPPPQNLVRRGPLLRPERVAVPIAVPVPIPVAPGVDPLSKLSNVLPSYFLAKEANTTAGKAAYKQDGSDITDPISNADTISGAPASTMLQPPVANDGVSPMSTDVAPGDAVEVPPPQAGGTSQLPGVNPGGDISLSQERGGMVNTASDRANPFDKFLMGKFAQEGYPYFTQGLAPGASLLVAGMGGYGGAQLGSALAGLGTQGSAAKQLANVEAQLMDITKNPHLSGREKRKMLAQLNREAALHGVRATASMPGSVGQAEASFNRMSRDLGGKIHARRLPGMRGLGIVAGAAAPFILPDFLRRMGVV